MDSRKAWRMDIAERTNNTIQQDKQHIPTGQTKKSSRSNNIAPQVKQKKSNRTNSIFQQVKQKKPAGQTT